MNRQRPGSLEALRRRVCDTEKLVLAVTCLLAEVIWVTYAVVAVWWPEKLVIAAGFLLAPGAILLGIAVGTGISLRRARQLARQMSPAEVASALRPLAEHEDRATRQVALTLMKQLCPEGRELVAANPPPGSGSEPAPE